VSIPFVIAGICLGAMDRERRAKEREAEAGVGATPVRLAPSPTGNVVRP
jgi:hypothetical protein